MAGTVGACSTPKMISPDAIDAVVFDMGGVFVVPCPDTIGGALTDAGIEHGFGAHNAAEAHYAGIRAITELLPSREVVEHDRSIWQEYDRVSFAHIGLRGDALEAAVAVRGEMRNRFVPVWEHLLDDNIAAFARIADVRAVAIVTNNDGTAVDQCLRFGICQLDDGPLPKVPAIVDSTVVEIAKPDPAIFSPALDALGTEPARTLYVGDTVHADVLGATAAGMPVVQLDPLDLHGDHDHWRLPDVGALADHLGAS